MLKTLVLLNDNYAHGYLKIGLHMLLDGIDQQLVFVIAPLLILTYLCLFPTEVAY